MWDGGQGIIIIALRSYLFFPPQDVEVEKTNHFAMVNLRTAAPTVCVSIDLNPWEIALFIIHCTSCEESFVVAFVRRPVTHL